MSAGAWDMKESRDPMVNIKLMNKPLSHYNIVPFPNTGGLSRFVSIHTM